MPVQHIVIVELKDGVSDEQMAGPLQDLRALVGKIPGLLSVKVGKNFSERGGNYSYAAVMVLEDKEALAGYGPHPAHQAAAGQLVELAESVLVMDFED